jgi:iron complex outermembrane recepter protein
MSWPSRFNAAKLGYAWGLATLLSLAPFVAPPVFAQSATNISLPASALEDALIGLARQTGASIGLPGRMPRMRVKGVRGHLTITQVLDQLLSGTGYQAVPVGPNAWRLVLVPHPPKALPKPKPRLVPRPLPQLGPAPPPKGAPVELPPAEIIITAAKRSDPLETTPIDFAIVDHLALKRFSAMPTSATVASLDTGLTLSNLGPGLNRAFLRGISDSPFNGQTQSTVATLLDDARVTFNAPDPDLRLVDVDRVELLKGPQGPLYGTGAIGGVYRIVTAKPQLAHFGASALGGVETLAHGGRGVSGSGMINIPLSQDRLALRAVAYGALEPGWIDNARPKGANSNRAQLRGGRLALRWRPNADWTVDLAGAVQLLHVDDSQYVTDVSTLKRSGIEREPHDNDFANARLSITGKMGSVDLFSTTSWTTHEVDSIVDASPAAALFGLNAPIQFEDDRLYRVFNQELRASGRNGRLQWMVGGSLLSAMTRVDAKLKSKAAAITSLGTLNQEAQEFALFGNLGFDLTDIWTVDAGVRLFSARINDEKLESAAASSLKSTKKGLSPSLAISAKPNGTSYYYARIASAFRPAGLSPFTPVPAEQFGSDELTTLEMGGRWHGPDRRFTAQAVIHGSQWHHIQSDYLLPNGLIGTRNSGTGLIYGVDVSATWHLDEVWTLSGGIAVQHASLEKAAPGLALPADRQLPIVPSTRANLDVTRSLSLGEWKASVTAHGAFIGPARLSLDPGLERPVRRYATLDLAASARRGPWSLGLILRNLLDSDADTNPYGNPFSIRTSPQHVPLRPLSISFTVGWALP